MADNDSRISNLISQADKMFASKNHLLKTWQEICDYILPRKSRILKKTTKVEPPVIIYDSTAMHANDLLASSMQGAFEMSRFSLAFEDEKLNKNPISVAWLDDCVRKMQLAMMSSNQRSASEEVFTDLTSIGTASMMPEEQKLKTSYFNGLQFTSFPIQDYAIDTNASGKVDFWTRVIEYDYRKAIQVFGDKAGETATKRKKSNNSTPIVYVQTICPREDSEFDIEEKYNYIEVIINKTDKEFVSKKGHFRFPLCVPRWHTITAENYGYSPSFNAIADVRVANKMKELNLDSLVLDVSPPWLFPDQLNQTGIIFKPSYPNYGRPDLIAKARTLRGESRLDSIRINLADVIESIKKIYYTDQLQIQKQAQMTATEATYTYELMHRLLGPRFGRIEDEYETVKNELVFEIMLERSFASNFTDPRTFSMPEFELESIPKIRYSGPLVRAQKQQEAEATRKWLMLIAEQSNFYPKALDLPKIDEVLTDVGLALGVPRDRINDSDVLNTIRRKKQRELEQANENNMTTEALSKMAPKIAEMAIKEQEEV